ncbi:YqaA family protein [Chloroflexota bacterium]
MSNNSEQAEVEKRIRLKEKVIPVLTILLVIAITAALFLFRDRVAELGNYGYLSAFLVSLITSATVVLPVPGIVVLFALAASLNPVLVGLVGATGAILGEMTGFMFGYGGRGIVQGRSRLYMRAEKWMRRWGSWAVFGFAAAPLPFFDVAGIVAGALHYPLWKFLLIGWVGKSIKTIILVLVGAWGWEAMLGFFT